MDGVRALAALFVVLCHAFYEPANGYYAGRLMNHLGLTYGHIAVDVFIVVSGFCLMLPVVRKGGRLGSVKTFLRKRARRILPPYYAALSLSCLYILLFAHRQTGTVWDNSLPLTWQQVLAHVFLVHDLPLRIPGGGINFPLWSIAVECQVYLLMPLIVLSLWRWGNGPTLCWTIGVGLLLHFATAGRMDSATPWYLGLFCLGAVSARQSAASTLAATSARHWRTASYVLWVFITVCIVLGGKRFFWSEVPIADTLIGAATAMLLAVTMHDASARRFIPTRALSWPPLVRVGVFSYSVYLVHAPLLHVADRIFTRTLAPRPEVMFLLLIAIIPAIVGVAYLFHLLFEKPFMTPKSSHPVVSYAAGNTAPAPIAVPAE